MLFLLVSEYWKCSNHMYVIHLKQFLFESQFKFSLAELLYLFRRVHALHFVFHELPLFSFICFSCCLLRSSVTICNVWIFNIFFAADCPSTKSNILTLTNSRWESCLCDVKQSNWYYFMYLEMPIRNATFIQYFEYTAIRTNTCYNNVGNTHKPFDSWLIYDE